MISWGYVGDELRRRWSRTFVTALGLAAGVGLVVGIISVSNGLTDAQNKVLSPLSSVGTDIIITRTVGATTASASATTTTTLPGVGVGGGPGGGGFSGGSSGGAGGGGFIRAGALRGESAAALNALDSSDTASLLNANSSVLTDLSKLGPAGTQFTYDFFVPGTLITFPQQAVQVADQVKGVESAVPALSLQALHETGTVPKITATYQTGGQTLTQTVKPPPLTAAQSAAVRTCLESSGAFSTSATTTPTTAPTGNTGTITSLPGGGSGGGGSGGGGFGGGGGGGGSFAQGASNFRAELQNCLPASYQQYNAQVTVPEQTITQVLNPPSTNTQTSSYTVAGVDPSNPNTGLITKAQLVKGAWFGAHPANEVLVSSAYASTKSIKVGQTLTIDKATYTVVGLVNPTLTGDTSDIYFDLATVQSAASEPERVNEILVQVNKSSDVNAVAKQLRYDFPGAQVLTSKDLANQVTGSLSDANTLAKNLGGALAVIILLAAFLIAALLTMSSISKRVREIGTLRAVGWSRGRVVRQIMAETVGIGIVGAIIGVLVGLGVCGLIDALGPTLTSTSSGTAVGASTVGSLFHQATSAVGNTKIHLQAPITGTTILLGVVFSVVGGLVAGIAGGWRAARMAPASALRDLG